MDWASQSLTYWCPMILCNNNYLEKKSSRGNLQLIKTWSGITRYQNHAKCTSLSLVEVRCLFCNDFGTIKKKPRAKIVQEVSNKELK